MSVLFPSSTLPAVQRRSRPPAAAGVEVAIMACSVPTLVNSRLPSRATRPRVGWARDRRSEVALALLHLHRPILVVVYDAQLPLRVPGGDELGDDFRDRVRVGADRPGAGGA